MSFDGIWFVNKFQENPWLVSVEYYDIQIIALFIYSFKYLFFQLCIHFFEDYCLLIDSLIFSPCLWINLYDMYYIKWFIIETYQFGI